MRTRVKFELSLVVILIVTMITTSGIGFATNGDTFNSVPLETDEEVLELNESVGDIESTGLKSSNSLDVKMKENLKRLKMHITT